MGWKQVGRWTAAVAVGMAGLVLAGGAQARSDVAWSVGIGAPGAQVIVGNAPVYIAPPVIVAPPRYYAPAPVYYEAPPPRAIYYAPRPVYYGPPPPRFHGHRHGHGYGHRHGRGHDRDWRR